MRTADGKSALLVHGAGGGGWEWRAWARVFAARGIEPHAPDLVPVDAGLAATRFQDYRRQVVSHARGLGDRPVLAGASLGGLLVLAAYAEVKARGLVLVNPVPADGVPGWPPAPREFPDVIPWGRHRDFESTRRAMPDCDHSARVLAYRRWRDESGPVMAEAHAGIELPSPGVPVLVIASGCDTDVPPSVSRAVAERLDGDFFRVACASHLGPLLGDSAADCARLACDWLDGLSGGRS